MTARQAVHDTAPDSLDELATLVASWRRHLRAQRMSPSTIATYSAAVTQLAGYLREHGMPLEVAAVHREHVEAWVTSLLERWKPTTAHNRYRGAHAFFRWLVDEGEIRTSPMERMKPPRLPEAPPPVLRDNELAALFAACERDRTFAGRRDEAIVRALADTGIRRSELLGLTLDTVDLERGTLRVNGKGSRAANEPGSIRSGGIHPPAPVSRSATVSSAEKATPTSSCSLRQMPARRATSCLGMTLQPLRR